MDLEGTLWASPLFAKIDLSVYRQVRLPPVQKYIFPFTATTNISLYVNINLVVNGLSGKRKG